MSFVIAPPSVIGIPIVDSHDQFPVRRVYCVGRNYAAHAREMGFDPDREPPFYFFKPTDAIVPLADGEMGRLAYPTLTSNFHYEAELVAVIGAAGADIAPSDALSHVWGYAVGLDMTRRDLQMKMREMGRPWEIGKAFDQSGPVGPIYPAAAVGHFESARIWLKVNGVAKQDSDVSKLIWSVAEVVADLSRYFTLEPGDLIFTGTPEGVGPVVAGDRIEVGIDRLGQIAVEVAHP
jgi:fumarylpyruvate hydrolase